MSLEKAQEFVSRMREDTEFRSAVTSRPDFEALKAYLQESGLDFSMHELVGAMASCMEEMEEMMALKWEG